MLTPQEEKEILYLYQLEKDRRILNSLPPLDYKIFYERRKKEILKLRKEEPSFTPKKITQLPPKKTYPKEPVTKPLKLSPLSTPPNQLPRDNEEAYGVSEKELKALQEKGRRKFLKKRPPNKKRKKKKEERKKKEKNSGENKIPAFFSNS